MDETRKEDQLPEEAKRPVWQVWAARIGLVVFIGFVILQLVSIARGGL